MNSKIAQAIRLAHQPVAVYHAKTCPPGAVEFQEGRWGCAVGLLLAAAKGRTAAFCTRTVACRGGRAGLGLKKFELGEIEYFLSTGEKGPKPGEHYKKTPQLALDYINGLPELESDDYVIFQPLNEVAEEIPELVIFLVNPDQLSGLATLANYDMSTQDNVKIQFGAGCVQSVLYGLAANERRDNTCYIGLTDPSARKCIPKELLSFTIPYARFLVMEDNADHCFFHTETWETIAKRI